MVNDGARIVVSGLSPAWQQIVLLDSLRAGEVNRAAQVQWCASGKVLNVGRALHALGAAQTTVALVGGPGGEQIRAEWGAEQIDALWVVASGATRVCTTIVEQRSGVVTELVENAVGVSPQELEAFASAFARTATGAALAVHTGSLPTGTPADWYRRVLLAATCPAILDVRGPELLAALEAGPLLVKPNREELAGVVGRTFCDESDVWDAMTSLREAGAQWALITQGANAALLAGPAGRWRVHSQRVRAVNPIGCGDCLTAGIAARLVQSCANVSEPTTADMLEAVRYGVAAAAENAAAVLPARLSLRRVAEVAATVMIEPHAAS